MDNLLAWHSARALNVSMSENTDLQQSTDPHYGPGPEATPQTSLPTTPMDCLYRPPQNRIKIRNEDFTSELSNRLLMLVKV